MLKFDRGGQVPLGREVAFNIAAAQSLIPTAMLPVQSVDINPVNTDLPKVRRAAAAARIMIQPDQEELSWPAIAMAHIMACDDPAKPLAKSTAQFMIRLVARGVLETGGLTPLSDPVRVLTFPALKVEVPTDPRSPGRKRGGRGQQGG